MKRRGTRRARWRFRAFMLALLVMGALGAYRILWLGRPALYLPLAMFALIAVACYFTRDGIYGTTTTDTREEEEDV